MASKSASTISPELLINRIADMYKKGGFFEKYSKDVVITVFVILAVLTGMTYFIVDANMINIKKSWTSYRCKPFILPLAGFINAPQDMDKSQYTSENFNFCASAMFKFVFDNAISVFYYMVATVTNIFKQCLEAIEQIRRLYVRIKEQFLTFVIETVRSILNFIVPFINLLVKLRDMMRKMEGVFLSIIYMLGGAYLALKSLFGTILTLCIIIIVVLLVILIIMWVLVAVFWSVVFLVPFHPPILAAAITFTVTTLIIVILFTIVAVFCGMVFQTNSSVPKVKSKAGEKMEENKDK
jgi:hypothetical protein